MNAAAAPQQGADIHAGTDTQPAGALRPHEPLVAGEAQYVHAQRGHVDRHRPCRLRGIQNQQRAVGLTDLLDPPDVAGEAVGDDDVAAALDGLLGLDVADEVQVALLRSLTQPG